MIKITIHNNKSLSSKIQYITTKNSFVINKVFMHKTTNKFINILYKQTNQGNPSY